MSDLLPRTKSTHCWTASTAARCRTGNENRCRAMR